MADPVARALTAGGLPAAALAFTARSARADESDALTLVAQIEVVAMAALTAVATLPLVRAVTSPVVRDLLVDSLQQHTDAHSALVAAGASADATVPDIVETVLDLATDPVSIAALPRTLTRPPGDLAELLTRLSHLESVLMATAAGQARPSQSATVRTLLGQVAGAAGQRLAGLRTLADLLALKKTSLLSPPPHLAQLPASSGTAGASSAFVVLTDAVSS